MKKRIRQPNLEDMDARLRDASRAIGDRLDAAGFQAWLVGGCVRDLALGIPPHDIDIATDARPDEVRATFERTVAVGAAFGTILVLEEGMGVEVTTFRTDGAYLDGRRPESVRFGTTLEEDAARRDFTCNALYLSPRTGELRDPENGIADLARGHLACVGDPAERFREDGLRILRLGRFAAAFELEVDQATLQAAKRERGSLAGISRERVIHELERIAGGRVPARAIEIFREVGALESCFPGAALRPGCVARLGPEPGFVRLLATLFEDPGIGLGTAEERREARIALLKSLRISRRAQAGCLRIWELEEWLEGTRRDPEGCTGARAVRILRDPWFADAFAVHRACRASVSPAAADLAARAASSKPEDLHPEPLVTAADLRDAGLEPGPEFGVVLREVEDLQLERRLRTRSDAIAWLRERVASARRKPSSQDSPEGEE